MGDVELILQFAELIAATLAAFFGIFLMAYTRDIGWIAIILGVVVRFVALMFSTFQYFGIIAPVLFLFEKYPVTEMVMRVFPGICFSLGFAIILLRKRKNR